MKSGMDRKTARKYRNSTKFPHEARTPHTWRTRPDPLAVVWPRIEELLQKEPALQAKTLWDWLQQEYPEGHWERVRRTLERRVRQWKGQHGPAQEVFFAQVHEPGRLGASDFTHMDALGVTIAGQRFPHLVYHFGECVETPSAHTSGWLLLGGCRFPAAGGQRHGPAHGPLNDRAAVSRTPTHDIADARTCA
jgi:hypothetical protein